MRSSGVVRLRSPWWHRGYQHAVRGMRRQLGTRRANSSASSSPSPSPSSRSSSPCSSPSASSCPYNRSASRDSTGTCSAALAAPSTSAVCGQRNLKLVALTAIGYFCSTGNGAHETVLHRTDAADPPQLRGNLASRPLLRPPLAVATTHNGAKPVFPQFVLPRCAATRRRARGRCRANSGPLAFAIQDDPRQRQLQGAGPLPIILCIQQRPCTKDQRQGLNCLQPI